VSPYDQLDSPEEMRSDAAAVHLPAVVSAPSAPATTWLRDLPTRELEVSEAARRLASVVVE